MAHLYIAAAHKSSGKTTVSLGLCAALRSAGFTVQAFKKGPDYIDPIWLGLATGRDCFNLDFNTMNEQQLRHTAAARAWGADVALIEGNKGLFDGVDTHGGDSNAALAQLLRAPVILVIDTRGMTRGIAPLVLGYQAFDKAVQIAAVVLNQVGGARHEAKLRAALKEYTDLPVVGVIHQNAQVAIEERHLGLVPGNEVQCAQAKIDQICNAVGAGVDLNSIIQIAMRAPPLPTADTRLVAPATSDVRIGIPRDAAFGFYYADDLEKIQRAGAELVFFDSLRDRALPRVHGLFIGGGFPETQMQALQNNDALRADVFGFIERGGPVYAECGGLMYLARNLTWRGHTCEMVGALPLDIVMQDRPVGKGYVVLTETGRSPWGSIVSGSARRIPAHEFHYSRIENIDPSMKFAYRVERGHGIDGEYDGLIHKNVVANYAHLRSMDPVCWVEKFLGFVRRCANNVEPRRVGL